MSKFLKLAKKHYCSQQKSAAVSDKKLPICFSLLACFLTFIIAVIYLVQVNGMATLGFKMDNLEERAIRLERNNKKLELDVAKLQSLSRVEGLNKELEMVSVDKVDYLSLEDISVAVK